MNNEQLISWIEGYLHNNFDIASVTIKNKIKEAREAATPVRKTTLTPSLMDASDRALPAPQKAPPTCSPQPVWLNGAGGVLDV